MCYTEVDMAYFEKHENNLESATQIRHRYDTDKKSDFSTARD